MTTESREASWSAPALWRFPTDNRNLLKISTSVKASRPGCNYLFSNNVKNFWRCAQIKFDSIKKNFIL
jgi:hypothetical protein